MREIRDLNIRLNSSVIKLYTRNQSLKKETEKLGNTIHDLVTRRDEFLKRLKSKVPDDVLGGQFEDYKMWIAEPYIVKEFEPYKPKSDRDVYIDPHSLLKSIPKMVKKIENPKEEEET